MTRMNTPCTMVIITNAITLAQKHLDKLEDEEPAAAALPVATEQAAAGAATSVSALKAQIAEQQRALAVMQGQGQEPVKEVGEKRKREFRGGRPKGGELKEWRTCKCCWKRHAGEPPEDYCYSRTKASLEADRAKIDALIKQKAAYEARSQGGAAVGEEKHRKQASFIEELNEQHDDYSVWLCVWKPALASTLTDTSYRLVCLNVMQQGACIDSGSQVNIQPNPQHAQLTFGPKVKLNGIAAGATRTVDPATVHFPTVDENQNPMVIQTEGPGLLYKEATSTIVLLALLLTAKYKVHFEVGRPADPEYSGTITSPDGSVITMVYAKGTWCLPTLTPDKARELHQVRYLNNLADVASKIPDNNTWKELLQYDVPLVSRME